MTFRPHQPRSIRHRRFQQLGALIWMLAVSPAVLGQALPPPEELPAVPMHDNRPGTPAAAADRESQRALQDLIAQLRHQRQALMADVEAEEKAYSQRPLHTASHPGLKQLRQQLRQYDHEHQEQLSEINNQLSRLEQLLQQTQRTQSAASPPATEHQDEPVPPAPEPPEPAPQDRSTDSQADQLAAERLKQQAKPEPPDDAAQEDHFTTAMVDAVAVTNQPVDRLALANNLYATGEYKLALQIYEQLDRDKMVPADQVWTVFQIAGCHRNLYNRSEAERYYRIVAATEHAGYWAESARWWLDALSKTARVQTRLDQLGQGLDFYQKELER